MTRYLSVADTAKEVRKALKSAFPSIKFSVRSKSYAGGASINVKWVDGATQKAVEQVAKPFAGATFDGMTDMKSYHTSTHNGEKVSWGADFVFCERQYSVPFLTKVSERVAKEWGQKPIAIHQSEYFGARPDSSDNREVASGVRLWELVMQQAAATPA